MRSGLDWLSRVSAMSLVCAFLLTTHPGGVLFGQDADSTPASDSAQSSENSGEAEADEGEEVDPFAVPENATNEELFKFMDATRRIQPPQRTRAGITEHAQKVFPAIIAAADLVLAQSDSEEDLQQAAMKKFDAYSILSQYDRSVAPDFEKLIEEYADDERPALAVVAVGYQLQKKGAGLANASAEEAQQISDEVLAFVERFGMSKATYTPASGLARSLGYTEHTEIAARLYESLIPPLQLSEEEALRSRADSMMGAARRLRLPGNTMELTGLTADGAEFDWSDYRGKVVLVDFWASWCGPCLSELPNMKKNLEKYGEKGFEIVGINMDSTRAAFEKCVEDKEITWVNILSEEAGKTGWNAPMATYYGVTGIPTAVLVNQEGRVASLRARGRELDRLLEELLGPVEEQPTESEKSSADEAQEDEPQP